VSVSGSHNGGVDGPKAPEQVGAKDVSLGSVSVDYSSKDRRQINRATIGEGTIIIRSDPNAGLEGLNRDLARAQEITKDSETVVSVYIDPAAIKEIASGFEGIRSDLRKIAEIVKKALPDGPIAKSLEAQAELAESLKAQGVTEEGLAEQISAANPFEAKVLSELAALEQQYGTLENVPDEVAQRMLTALQMDPDVAILVAAGDGFQIVVSEARATMVRLLGMVNSAGECTGATLRLVDDLCKYTVSMATGGVAFPESRERIVAMTLDVGSAIAELASSPLESVKLAGKAYAKKCDEIQQLEQQGRYDEAQYELGRLLFDVAASIQGLAAAGKVVVSQGSKLASVVSKVKGPRALTVKIEHLADIGSLDSSVQFIEIWGVRVQKPLGRGNSASAEFLFPKNLLEEMTMKAALTHPELGIPVQMGKPMRDPRWPAEEGWIKMSFVEKSNNGQVAVVHYVMNSLTGAVDDFKFKR